MPNMSYCKFENTLGDLRDCYYTMLKAILDDGMSPDEFVMSLSVTERHAFQNMVDYCKSIVELAEGVN